MAISFRAQTQIASGGATDPLSAPALSAMPAVDLSGLPNCTMRGVISYQKGASDVWATPVCANAVDNTTASTGIDPPASGTTISFSAGDWFGSFAAINGDVGTVGTHTATVAGGTFGTQNARLVGTTSSGHG